MKNLRGIKNIVYKVESDVRTSCEFFNVTLIIQRHPTIIANSYVTRADKRRIIALGMQNSQNNYTLIGFCAFFHIFNSHVPRLI